MRRGTRGGGYAGGNRPGAPHQPQLNIPRLLQPSQSHSGPLADDHLQGLKDIDLELELLKRKREIIEQQQQILSDSYRPRYEYQQPIFSQGRQSRYDDFTRLYDNPREPEYGNRGAGGRKRPHIPVWEHEAPPRRLPAPSRGGKKPSGSRLSPAATSSRWAYTLPAPAFPAPKPNRRPPPAPQKKKEFQPSKVSKPAPAPAAKLASQPPAERSRLVAEALSASARAADALVLRADSAPSHLMVGRLELALGGVMKDIKSEYPQHEQIIKLPYVQRAMKQCVRDRIRTAMIGKAVTTTESIMAAYYQMFPRGRDDDVVMKGLMVHENKDFVTVNADNPETFFKKNIRNLMVLKMEEMFNKLQAEYNEGAIISSAPPNRPKCPRVNSRATAGPQSEAKPQAAETQPVNVTETAETNSENVTETVETKPEIETEKVETKPENVTQTAETNSENVTETVETKPEIETEKVETKPENVIQTSETNSENVTQTVETKSENVPQEVETQVENVTRKVTQPKDNAELKTNAEAVKDVGSTTNESSAEAQPKAEFVKPAPPKKTSTLVIPKQLIDNEHYLALDKLLTYKMLHLLKRYAPEFLNYMEVDAMYRKTKAAIVAETAMKLGKKPENETKESPANSRPTLPYFTRILGKPSLPKRKAMEGFFKEFTPRIIKKHRTIHNMLFVGFAEKEPFEKMLAADGIAIGRCTLEIKVSEKIDKKKNENTAIDSSTPEADKLNESTDTLNVIGPDLDEQITELLTSIRSNESNDDPQNFSDDIVMAEPPEIGNNKDKENGEEDKVEAVADKNADNEETMDDIVEATNVPQSDDVQNNDEEIVDAQNDDDVVKDKDVQSNAVEMKDTQNEDDVEVKVVTQEDGVDDKKTKNDTTTEKELAEKKDTVRALKTDVTNVKLTPTRASARLASPCGIKTRRMSKLTE